MLVQNPQLLLLLMRPRMIQEKSQVPQSSTYNPWLCWSPVWHMEGTVSQMYADTVGFVPDPKGKSQRCHLPFELDPGGERKPIVWKKTIKERGSNV